MENILKTREKTRKEKEWELVMRDFSQLKDKMSEKMGKLVEGMGDRNAMMVEPMIV